MYSLHKKLIWDVFKLLQTKLDQRNFIQGLRWDYFTIAAITASSIISPNSSDHTGPMTLHRLDCALLITKVEAKIQQKDYGLTAKRMLKIVKVRLRHVLISPMTAVYQKTQKQELFLSFRYRVISQLTETSSQISGSRKKKSCFKQRGRSFREMSNAMGRTGKVDAAQKNRLQYIIRRKDAYLWHAIWMLFRL